LSQSRLAESKTNRGFSNFPPSSLQWLAAGGRASKSPQPKTQTAENKNGQNAWPQWHRITSYKHFWPYYKPRQLRNGQQTEHHA
jgi:hypothetical protein